MTVFEENLFDFGEDDIPPHTDLDPEWIDSYEPGTFRLVSAKNHRDDGFEFACNVPDIETAVVIGNAWYRRHPFDIESVWIIDGHGNKSKLHPPEPASDAGIIDAVGADVEQRMAERARGLDSLEGVTLNDLAGVPREQ